MRPCFWHELFWEGRTEKENMLKIYLEEEDLKKTL